MNKICKGSPIPRINTITKLGRAMKLTSIALFVFSTGVCASVHSQNMRVNIHLNNTKTQTVLEEIEKQTDYLFIYNTKEVDLNRKVSVSAQDETVSKVLSAIFDGTNVSYAMEGSNIMLMERPSAASAPQQDTRRVTGTIVDASGVPVIGANVMVKGTTIGTITDMDGKFTLEVPKGAILQISYIGYIDQTVSVGEQNVFNVALKEDTQRLDEVVVVGYGVQKKVSTTNAVAQLKGEELTVRPTSNAQQILQGLSPGLTITDAGGSPGRSSATIRVRGVTTLTTTENDVTIGSNDPLVLVDGVEQRFDDINMNDIESISVLKDAASAAIYGSRAANGVILVTTKRAKSGEVNVKYNGFFSLASPQNKPKHMGLEDYMRYQNLAYVNSGAEPKYSEEYIQEYVNASDRLKYPLPNVYMDEMYRVAPMIDNNISISGGSKSFKGLLSLRHKNEEGILSSYDNKVTSMRINTDFKKKIFSFSADADFRYNYSAEPIANVINYIYHGSQWAVPRYPDGTYGLSPQGNNPMILNDIAGQSKLRKYYFVGNLKMDVDILPFLKVSAQYSAKVTNDVQKDFSNAYKILDYYDQSVVKKNVDKNSLKEIRRNENEQTFTGLLNFYKTFGNHDVNVLLGYSQIVNKNNYLEGYKEYFYSNDLVSMDMGGEDNRKISGYDHAWGLRSFFGRVNYNFKERYLLEFNGRWDGSSRFVGSGVYAFFPSASAAWRISQEQFWNKDNWLISDLKIRASWGKTGNQAIPLYEFYPALVSYNYAYNNEIQTGYIQKKMSNPDLTWETTTQTDIGLDAYFLNNKLSMTFDYYNKVTDGILLTLPIPGAIGLEAPLQNAGSVLNRGVELMISWHDSFKEFNYNISANFAYNKNEITDLAGTGPYKTTSSTDPMTIRAEGLPIDSHWGYLTDGLFQTQEEVDNYPTLFANTKPGDVKYVDLNGDGQITPEDMTYLGNTFPKYTFGLNGSISYKGFELFMQWQGAADVDVRLSGALSEMGNQEGFTHEIYANNVWTPEHTDARFPRPVKFDLRNCQSSDRVIFDGSYLRLKTLQLSYNLPVDWTRKFYVQRAKLSVTATNLLTFSALNEWNLDPEFPSGRAAYYPQSSVYSLGVNLEF